MNPPPPPQPPSPATAKKESQLQGPRPSPLRVNKDSHKIKKPPIAPKPSLPHAPPQQPPTNQPMIIYSVSPKPIHVEPSDFMSIVQRLTGRASPPATFDCFFQFSGEAPVSPAARFAAVEMTSPSEREERERRRDNMRDEILVGLREENDGILMGQMTGILSPAPANLPVINPGLFSPVPGTVDGSSLFGENDWMMSPFMNNYLLSPSTLFFSGGGTDTAFVSPTFSSPAGGDLFKIFDY